MSSDHQNTNINLTTTNKTEPEVIKVSEKIIINVYIYGEASPADTYRFDT